MRKQILFVDDEPNILEGLRRALYPLRQEWELSFASNGEAALAKLAQQPFDVVISDMRMPGMNGAEFLAKVQQHYPRVVRIIMSGYADQDSVLKSVIPTHQYLLKPYDTQTLQEIVGRATALRDLLVDDKLRQLVSNMQSLPSLPALYTEVTKELRLPNPSLKKIGTLISHDLGMTAKILQMVNSPFFGLRRHISSPSEAVSLLGLDTIASLIQTIPVFSLLKHEQLPGFSPSAFWNHSLRVGLCAKWIAQNEEHSPESAQIAFTAGLLHDTGHLVLAANWPQLYARVLKLVQVEHRSYDEATYEVFRATHTEVGAYLLGLLGLPSLIVEAVAFHRQPGRCLAPGCGPHMAVHVGAALEHERSAHHTSCCGAVLDMEYLTRLQLTEHLTAWRKIYLQVAHEKAA